MTTPTLTAPRPKPIPDEEWTGMRKLEVVEFSSHHLMPGGKYAKTVTAPTYDMRMDGAGVYIQDTDDETDDPVRFFPWGEVAFCDVSRETFSNEPTETSDTSRTASFPAPCKVTQDDTPGSPVALLKRKPSAKTNRD